MRKLALLAALCIAGTAFAQDQQNPLPPQNPQVRQEFKLIHADDAGSMDEDTFTLSGNVHAQFKGYDIYADKLIFTKSTQVARLETGARLIGDGSEVVGDVIIVNFKFDTYYFEEGKAQLSPETLKGETKDDVYLTAQKGEGTPSSFIITKGIFTTCDKPHPHSFFVVGSTHIRPGRNAKLRHVRLEVLGHTIFGIPYLVIPLVDNGRRYLPDVGNSPDEGQYLKTTYSIQLPGESYIDTRVDYLQKKGAGLGLDYYYEAGSIDGSIRSYTVLGADRTTTVTSKHTQKIGMGNLTVDTNYQNNNYLTAPQSTSLNSRMQYVLPWAGGTSRFSWFRVGNERPGFNSVTQNLSVSDQRAWSSWLNTQFDASLARADTNSSFGDTRNERLDIRFTGKTDLRSFTADLLYQRSIPVGETTNFFSATDRTPMLVLKTDARRLFEPGMARVWPFTSELSIGELADPASGGHISRLDFNFGMMRTETKGNSALRWGGRFKQGIYSDDTAQYVLDYNLGWSYQFDPRSRFELTYRNLRSFGFTPLSIDRTGRNDAFSMNLTYQLNKAFQLIARSGYDVLQADRGNVPWQQVWVQTNWIASPALQVRTSATYDTFNQLWNNLRLDASYDTEGFKFGLGTRYDGRNSVWAATSLYLEGLKIGRTRFATALDWNGYTSTFDAQHYSVIYDLHEAELVIDFMDNNVGFRSGQQIQIFIRLKAFPSRSPFGSGTRGQAIGSGTGWGF